MDQIRFLPPLETVKFNFDASVSTSNAGTGFLLWDHNSQVVRAVSKKIKFNVPLLKLQLLGKLFVSPSTPFSQLIMLEGDSMTVISWINGPIPPDGTANYILQDIQGTKKWSYYFLGNAYRKGRRWWEPCITFLYKERQPTSRLVSFKRICRPISYA